MAEDFSVHALLAFGADHLRMLAVWHAVPRMEGGEGEWGIDEPDVYRWAQLADVPVTRARDLWLVLRTLGAVRADRTVPKEVRGLLVRRVREMVEE